MLKIYSRINKAKKKNKIMIMYSLVSIKYIIIFLKHDIFNKNNKARQPSLNLEKFKL